MQEQYIRNDHQSILAHLVEECGEVQQAAGKSLRWGLDSVNPELPEDEQETNRDWLEREIKDLEFVIVRVKERILGHASAQ